MEKTKLVNVFATLVQNITPPLEAAERSYGDSDTDDESNDGVVASTCDVEPDILESI